MRKLLLSILTLTAGLLGTDAAEVSVSKARAIASEVLPEASFGQPRQAARQVAKTAKVEMPTPYYVFNAQGEKGFVIVAGDDRMPAVLGYSTEGSLDLNDAPAQLIALLQMSVELASTESEPSKVTSTGSVVVEPLLGNIAWGQDSPFNTMCPTLSNGTRGYVGCVATAMTQIMKYYNYPAKGTGSHSYTDGGQTLSADFGNTTYDWENMPADVPATPTAAQINAYSTLCSHVGIAVEMQYAAGGSGAYTMMVPGALTDHFGYSQALRMHSRSYYNTDEWMEMIRTELDAKRPVYYAATSEDMMGGHAFVCDGYDSEGYVHINWGWYGRSNGYFSINHLNPGELGTGGGSGAYNIQQEILTNFAPSGDSDVKSTSIYGATRLSGDSFGSDMMLMTFVENLDTHPFNGIMVAILTDANNTIVCELKNENLSVDEFKNGKSGSTLYTMKGVPTQCPTTVANGSYRIRLGYKSTTGAKTEILRHPLGLPSYLRCKVAGNTILNVETSSIIPNVKVTDMKADGDIHVNGSARFTAHINNLSDVFRLSEICLKLTSTDNSELTYVTNKAVNIYDLSEDDIEIHVDMPVELTEGTYKVTMYHKGYEENLFDLDETIVTLLPEATQPIIRLTGEPYIVNGTSDNDIAEREDKLMIAIPAKNYGAAGSSMIVVRLQSIDEPSKSYVSGAIKREWEKGETVSLSSVLTVRCDPGKYRIVLNQLDSDHKETLIEGYDGSKEIEVAESANTALEVIKFDLPTKLQQGGERVDGSLTVKALHDFTGTIYIRIRQFTYTDGEIVFMRNGVRLQAGETAEYNFKYRPDTELADGLYILMFEAKEGNEILNMGGQGVYYREIAMGDVSTSGIGSITNDTSGESDQPVIWYDLQGRIVSDASKPGLYIKKQGDNISKVLIK